MCFTDTVEVWERAGIRGYHAGVREDPTVQGIHGGRGGSLHSSDKTPTQEEIKET